MSARLSIWLWCLAFVVAGLALIGETAAWRWWHTAAALVTILAAVRITARADELADELEEATR